MLTTHNYRSSFLLFFWLPMIFHIAIGCQHPTPIYMDQPTSSMQRWGEKQTQGAHAFGIVLLHGLMADAKSLDYYKNMTENHYKNKALLIIPEVREAYISFLKRTEEQADLVFYAIKSKLHYHHHPDSFPLAILGYSQGGNVACLFTEKYKDKFNIQCLYIVHAPLKGIPMDWGDVHRLQQLHNHTKELLPYIGIDDAPARFSERVKSYLSFFRIINQDDKDSIIISRILSNPVTSTLLPYVGKGFNGLNDLKTESKAIQSIAHFLRESNHSIPCRLIASYLDLQELCNEQLPAHLQSKIADANVENAKFVTNTENGKKHDMLIPLSSQLCRGDSFDDLSVIGNNAIKGLFQQDNISAKIYQGVAHSPKLIILDRMVDPNKTGLNSKTIVDDFISFIEEHMVAIEPGIEVKA